MKRKCCNLPLKKEKYGSCGNYILYCSKCKGVYALIPKINPDLRKLLYVKNTKNNSFIRFNEAGTHLHKNKI